jgi:hypothetical protein
MSTASSQSALPPSVLEALQLQAHRISPIVSAKMLWDKVLTEDDRRRLGSDLYAAYNVRHGTIGMWMWLHNVNYPRAVVDVAWALGFLDPVNHDWLRKEIGETRQKSADRQLPVWDNATGELIWNGQTIATFLIKDPPSDVQRVLEAFAEERWPKSIANPLPGPFNQHRLHQLIKYINGRLTLIHFRVQKGAMEIVWEPIGLPEGSHSSHLPSSTSGCETLDKEVVGTTSDQNEQNTTEDKHE